MPRMSSSRMMRYDSSSILISVPPYFEISTLSPFFTVKSIFLPFSSILPVPRATTFPSCGFSLAVSGMMIPPFFTSCSSSGCTSTRSPSGFTLTVAISCCSHSFWFVVVPAAVDLLTVAGKLFPLFFLVAGNLIAQLFQLLFALIGEHVGIVLDLDCFLRLLVLFRMRFSFALHFLDFLFRKAGAAGDRDFLLSTSAKIFRANMQNAVRIDVECDFDLRNAARGRRDTVEVEYTELLVIAAQWTLALQHLDLHARLIVAVSRKDLRFARWDRGIPRNHWRCHAASGLDRQSQRCDVEQQHIFYLAFKNAALNRRANRDDFVRVHAFMRFLADEAAGGLDYFRHARHAAHQHELVHVALGKLRIFQTILDRLHRALDERIGELLEFCAGQLLLNVLRPARVRRDERQIDLVFLRARQRNFCFFSFFFDSLYGIRLFGQINPGILFEFADDPVHDLRIPVVTAEVRIAIGRFHLENAVADFKNGDVERAATQIVNRNLLVFLLVEAVSERRGCGLIDDAQHFKTCDFARVLGSV